MSKRIRHYTPINYTKNNTLKIITFIFLVILYLPIINLIMFSFNDSKRNIVWRGFTSKYYEKLFENEMLFLAFSNSITIAITSTIISTFLGLTTAIVLWKFNFYLKKYYDIALLFPIIIPEICMGISMLVFFSYINWPNFQLWPFTLSSIIIAHVSFIFPFVAIIIRGRLSMLNNEILEAGLDLGANKYQVIRKIIIPFMSPALVASALLAFTLSLDDFVVTFFTSGPNSVTLPVKIYSMVRFGISPEINAISTLLILIIIICTYFTIRFLSKSNREIIK
ncbi:MAG: spermidine/putrescine ABC transporter permease PotC [Flavobacteriaceae bacterium]|nr:spermidine/putrescine ABC transporter permease PotC [Flavobacteriaceae bacterium]